VLPLYSLGLPKNGWPCESFIADNAAVESSGRDLITASANRSACCTFVGCAALPVGGYRLPCSEVGWIAGSRFSRIPAASERRTSRDAVLILTNPAVLVKFVLLVLPEKTSSSCQARIPFWSNLENSGRPMASVCPPAPLELKLAEVGISGRGPPGFVTE
jgi:hypothetical protein